MVVQINGAELLRELRPFDMQRDNQAEVPVEWLSPVWPLVASLAERIRVFFHEIVSFFILFLYPVMPSSIKRIDIVFKIIYWEQIRDR